MLHSPAISSMTTSQYTHAIRHSGTLISILIYDGSRDPYYQCTCYPIRVSSTRELPTAMRSVVRTAIHGPRPTGVHSQDD